MNMPENQVVTSPQQVEEYRLLVGAGVDPDIAADTISLDNGVIAEELVAATGTDALPEEALEKLMTPVVTEFDRELYLTPGRLVFLTRAAGALGLRLVPMEAENG